MSRNDPSIREHERAERLDQMYDSLENAERVMPGEPWFSRLISKERSVSYADYTRHRPDEPEPPEEPESDDCPTCEGTGEVQEAHESYAVETLGCPHCMGTGKKGPPAP